MPEVFVLDRDDERLFEENNSLLRDLTKSIKEIGVSKKDAIAPFAGGAIFGKLSESQKKIVSDIQESVSDLPVISQSIDKSINELDKKIEKLRIELYGESGENQPDKRRKEIREKLKEFEVSKSQVKALEDVKMNLNMQKDLNKKDMKMLSNVMKVGTGAVEKSVQAGTAMSLKGMTKFLGKIGLAIELTKIVTKPITEAMTFMRRLTTDRIASAISIAMEPLNGVLELFDAVLAPLFIPFFTKLAQGVLTQLPKITELVEKYQDKFTKMADDLIERVIPALPNLIEGLINLTMLDWSAFIGLMMIFIPALDQALRDPIIPFLQRMNGFAERVGQFLDDIGQKIRSVREGMELKPSKSQLEYFFEFIGFDKDKEGAWW